ncbi:MAG: beta-ketoacyl synthase N-terminal-like domain-containing protein [Gemmatimonadales bacterium]
MTRIGVFGWGLVAPKSPDIDTFATNLAAGTSWLEPFNGYGPDSFLVGRPAFDFQHYRGWISERFPPRRFAQLVEKMDEPTLVALGSFIQALGQNPGIEQDLQELGGAAHVYVAPGLGAIGTYHDSAIELYHAQRRWDRFWADPVRNPALTAHLAGTTDPDAPPSPEGASIEERDQRESAWWRYWAAKSPGLAEYLERLRRIEGINVEGEIEVGKIKMMRDKSRQTAALEAQSGAPLPPWKAVSANMIWNLHNTPAAQISMLGRITGLSFAPVGACSTFGLALKLAIDAIRRGEAKAVVVGATDPSPHPLIVGAFYQGRVISADGDVSKPLHGLRGTHIAGGAAIWIVGDYDYFAAKGYRALGMEPVSVGTSSDAHHIITPSTDGPLAAIRQALEQADATPESVGTWDLHATATPGDYLEVDNLRRIIPASVLVTARKGTFGHGMGGGGGWELTAQYLGVERGSLFPTPLDAAELHPSIRAVHPLFVFNEAVPAPGGLAGKLSMGIGGINACVLSRPW